MARPVLHSLRPLPSRSAALAACVTIALSAACGTSARSEFFATRALSVRAAPGDGSRIVAAPPLSRDAHAALSAAGARSRADSPALFAGN